MRPSKRVSLALSALVLLCGTARSQEANETPPVLARFTEKKFSHEQYQAAILGKVVFRKGKKPLEPKEAVTLTFVKKEAQDATVSIKLRDGEAFLLQAAPGSYHLKEVARAGRVYRIQQAFAVAQSNVVYLGIIGIDLQRENRAAYEYGYRLDATVDKQVFARNPELSQLLSNYCPSQLWGAGGNQLLFVPNYDLGSVKKMKEEKSLAKASKNGDLATARELLAAGADPSVQDSDGWAPLHSALRNGHGAIADLLLDHGASLNQANSGGWTPLMIALRYEQKAQAARMIQMGAEVDRKEGGGWSPLLLAARHQPENVQLLLDCGAPVNERNKAGGSSLMLAAGFAPEAVVQALLDKGADVMARDNDNWTPLMWALHHGRTQTARRLIERGVDIHAKDNEGWTMLMTALRYDQQDSALLLLDKGARINESNKNGWTPLHFALRNGHTEAGRRLIEGGADMNSLTSDGLTPLILALSNGQAANARLLIDKGAEIEAKDQEGWTPLMYALRYNQAECAKLLAQKTKRIDEKNKDGWTALLFALRYEQPEAAALLIQRGAAFNYKTEGGWEPLLTALRYNQSENARRLILKGADVNAKIDEGWTALMLAIDNDQPENAKLLIKKGADASVQNKNGDTALALAHKKNYFELISLLGPSQPPSGAGARQPAAPAPLPPVLAKTLTLPPGATVISAGDCSPGLNGMINCAVTLEITGRRAGTYDIMEASLKKSGWLFDRGEHAQTEDASLPGHGYWGYLGFRRQQPDGLLTAVVTFPQRAATKPDKTQFEITYQRFPSQLTPIKYSQVVATYPSGATQCNTVVDVTAVSPTGQWTTMGLMQYRNHVPQLKCLGTRITLKVPLVADGIKYDVDTKLTVDKNLKWIAVESWD